MVETYRYFDLEVDVQRAGAEGVRWFMTYYFDDELERAEFRGITKQKTDCLCIRILKPLMYLIQKHSEHVVLSGVMIGE